MITQSCLMDIGTEEQLRKFRFGGVPEGNVDIYPDRLVFFTKSRKMNMAFGLLGSIAQGKGKQSTILTKDMVDSVLWAVDKKGRVMHYNFFLKDGRRLFLSLSGFHQEEAAAAIEEFAADLPRRQRG